MPRHSRSSHSVTLFPFLAVLVCAMGALIFLLLVTTRYIRSDAENEPEPPPGLSGLMTLGQQSITAAPQPPPAPPPDPERQPEVLYAAGAMPLPALNLPTLPIVAPLTPRVTHPVTSNASIAKLRAELQDHKRQLEQRRSELQSLLDQAAKTQSDIARLKQQTQTTRKTNLDQQRRHRELLAAAEELKRQITQLERQLQLKRAQAGGTENRFAFVAYDGKDGTLRRPILIECTNRGFQFLSENIALGSDDFRGFIPAVNPLLAGSRALLRHLQSHSETADTDDQPTPYVLLLVRPNGISTYYAARRMLSQLGTDFGYELLEADAEISAPASSPEAIAACRQAIEGLLAQRNDIAILARPHSRPLIPSEPIGRGRRTLQMTRNGRIQVHTGGSGDGGSGSTPGTADSDRGPHSSGTGTRSERPSTNPLASGTAQGRPDGVGGHNPQGASRPRAADGSFAGVGNAAQQDPAQLNPSGAIGRGDPTGRNLRPAPGHAAGGQGNRATSAPSTSLKQRSSAGTGRRNVPGTRPGDPSPTALGGSAARTALPGQHPKTPATGTRRPGGIPGNRSQLSNGRPTGSADGSLAGSPHGRPAQAGQPRAERQTPSRNTALRNGNHGVSQTARGATDGDPRSTAPGNDVPARDGASQKPGTRTGRRAAPGGTQSATTGRRLPIARLGSAGSGTSTGSRRPGSASGGGGMPATAGSGQPGQAGRPASSAQIGGSFGRSRSRTSPSNRRSRKRNWGLMGRQASIGFERNVVVDVTADKITVGNAFVVSGRLEHRSLVHFVVEAIDRHARSWGRPPDSFYWVPSLQFVVAPDGQSNLKILMAELRRFGLPSRVRNRSEPHEQQPSQRP